MSSPPQFRGPQRPPAPPREGPAPDERAAIAARALVAAGLVAEARAPEAALVLGEFTQEGPPRTSKLSFDEDSQFLHSSIRHHVDYYVRNVLQPRTATFMQSRELGRVVKNEEVEAAVVEVTTSIFAEVGRGYLINLYRYLGSLEGAVNYVTSRVRRQLTEQALALNDEFLMRQAKSQRAARLAQRPAPDQKS